MLEMAELWPWLILAALGAYHGVNPAMGWLFAVALGLQEGRRGAVYQAFVPIALGHTISVAVVVGVVLLVRSVIPFDALKYIGAAILVGFGVYKLVRSTHPRWVGMRVGFRDLTAWSFLMASAHGAGLMLIPILFNLPGYRLSIAEAIDVRDLPHADYMLIGAPSGIETIVAQVTAVSIHTLAMFGVMAIVAIVIYEKVGVAILRRAWFNLDKAWAIVPDSYFGEPDTTDDCVVASTSKLKEMECGQVVTLPESPQPERCHKLGANATPISGRRGVLEPQWRTKRIGLGTTDYRDGGEVADAGQRHSECEEPLEPGTVYRDGILCRLHASVGDRVHYLQRFGRPECERGLYHDQAHEHTHPSGDGHHQKHDVGRRPAYVHCDARPGHDAEPLRESSDAPERQLLARKLERRGTWPGQQAVEVAGLDHVTEQVEASCGGVGYGKSDVHHTVQEGDFVKGPSLEIVEPGEEYQDRHEFDAGRKKVSYAQHDERGAILHLAAHGDFDVTHIEMYRVQHGPIPPE